MGGLSLKRCFIRNYNEVNINCFFTNPAYRDQLEGIKKFPELTNKFPLVLQIVHHNTNLLCWLKD